MNFLSFIKPLLAWNNLLAFLVLGGAFGAALFFRGTDSWLFVPALWGVMAYGILTLQPFWRAAEWTVPRSAVALSLFLFWAYMGISLFWSTVPYMSILFFFIIGTFPFVFFILVLAPDPQTSTRLAALVLMTVITAMAVWASIQFVFFYEAYGPRIKHPMLNPNNLAAVFRIGVNAGSDCSRTHVYF